MSALTDLRDSRELLVNLTRREVTSKYRRSVLGQGWSLVNPLATLLIYSLVFGVIIRFQPEVGDPSGLETFTFFLACALLPWQFFSNVVTGGSGAMLTHANLVTKVWFPREVLVTSSTAAWLFTFGIELSVLTVALLVVGASPTVLLLLPVVVLLALLLAAFGLGLALALSVAVVYFRDTAHFLTLFLQFWFFLTPIVYPLSVLTDNLTARYGSPDGGPVVAGWTVPVLDLYQANPMAAFVEAFRAVLYDNRLPDLGGVLYVAVWAAVSLVAGYAVFRRFAPRLAEEL